jgi:hypothetical protein
MGVLVNGRWTEDELAQETSERGKFQRVESQFRERVTADGSSASRPKRAVITPCIARLPVGSSSADLSCPQEARRRDLSSFMRCLGSSSRAGASRTTRGFRTAPLTP